MLRFVGSTNEKQKNREKNYRNSPPTRYLRREEPFKIEETIFSNSYLWRKNLILVFICN